MFDTSFFIEELLANNNKAHSQRRTGVSKKRPSKAARNRPVHIIEEDIFEVSDDGKILLKYKGTSAKAYVPEGTVILAADAFRDSAVQEVILPDSVQEIGDYCFSNSHLKRIELSRNLRQVGDQAFESSMLENISFPAQCTELGRNVLLGIRNIKRIDLPADLDTMGIYPFACCPSLKKFTIPDSNPHFRADKDGALYSKDGRKLIAVPGGFRGPFVIPDFVEELGAGCFGGCCHITAIVIPQNLKTIDEEKYNFCCCERLKRFSVDGGNDYFTTYEGVLLSKDRSKLISCPRGKDDKIYTVPSFVRKISANAFISCDSIGKIVVPNRVAIDANAFYGCSIEHVRQ